MDIKKCDIKTCKCEYTPDQGHKVVFGDKQYDLCENCFNKINTWMKEFLAEGTPVAIYSESHIRFTIPGAFSGTTSTTITLNGPEQTEETTNDTEEPAERALIDETSTGLEHNNQSMYIGTGEWERLTRSADSTNYEHPP